MKWRNEVKSKLSNEFCTWVKYDRRKNNLNYNTRMHIQVLQYEK